MALLGLPLAAVAALLWFVQSASGLPWVLRTALDRAGLSDIRFASAVFQDGRVIVEGVQTGGVATLTIARLEAEIGSDVLRSRRIARLQARGVRGTIALGGGGAASIVLPPVDEAVIDDIDLVVRGAGYAVALTGSVDARHEADAFVVASREARLRSLNEPAWFTPLRLQVLMNVTSPSAPIALDVKATDDSGALAIEVAGPFAIGVGETRLTAKLFPLLLIDDVRPVESLFPIAPRFIEKLSGTLSADFTITGAPSRRGNVVWNGAGRLDVKQVNVTARGFAIDGIDTALTFSELMPPVLRDEQSVTIKRAVAGLPFENIAARFTLSAKGVLDLQSLEAKLAEGAVRAAPLQIALDKPEVNTTLAVENVSLAALLAVAAVEGLSGEGTLGGTLPIATRDGVVTIAEGVLAALGPGVLRYRPKEATETGGGEISMLRQVLTDFRYKELKMQVDGAIGGEQSIVVRLVGSNPTFYDGYPVAFTLNLSGALEAIVRRGVGAYAIPDTLRTNIERLQRENQK